ncbi:hypothetical protein [uncultured Tateyamaria sp.]|uniref:hypothetical protein n=1 Tax=uncultured Tateyamaria sp. TaxID=455651 RepID=UPI002639B553|nr:hypothetical protein [uncultured Tateyamaria sp.]
MPVLVLILSVAFALSPIWVPDFGGFDADQFPIPQTDPSVQPAGYAFAIWGLIYVWLIAGCGYGAWRQWNDPAWRAMRGPLAASLAVGAVWLPVAVLSPVWATLLIWVMLVTALWALWRSPVTEAWAAAWPVGLYAGWLSAASFVALGLMLAGFGWASDAVAAGVMITAATALAFAVQMRLRRAPTYGIAVIWALIAIAVRGEFELSQLSVILALAGVALMIWPTVRATGK